MLWCSNIVFSLQSIQRFHTLKKKKFLSLTPFFSNQENSYLLDLTVLITEAYDFLHLQVGCFLKCCSCSLLEHKQKGHAGQHLLHGSVDSNGGSSSENKMALENLLEPQRSRHEDRLGSLGLGGSMTTSLTLHSRSEQKARLTITSQCVQNPTNPRIPQNC